MTKINITGHGQKGESKGVHYVETTPEMQKIMDDVADMKKKKVSMKDPLETHHKVIVGVLIVLIMLGIAVYMNNKYPKAEHEKLTQTDYVTKLGQENTELQSQIGVVMAQQVQMSKHVRATKEAYEGAINVYSGSVAKVIELEGKIQANKELMIKEIITQ